MYEVNHRSSAGVPLTFDYENELLPAAKVQPHLHPVRSQDGSLFKDVKSTTSTGLRSDVYSISTTCNKMMDCTVSTKPISCRDSLPESTSPLGEVFMAERFPMLSTDGMPQEVHTPKRVRLNSRNQAGFDTTSPLTLDPISEKRLDSSAFLTEHRSEEDCDLAYSSHIVPPLSTCSEHSPYDGILDESFVLDAKRMSRASKGSGQARLVRRSLILPPPSPRSLSDGLLCASIRLEGEGGESTPIRESPLLHRASAAETRSSIGGRPLSQYSFMAPGRPLSQYLFVAPDPPATPPPGIPLPQVPSPVSSSHHRDSFQAPCATPNPLDDHPLSPAKLTETKVTILNRSPSAARRAETLQKTSLPVRPYSNCPLTPQQLEQETVLSNTQLMERAFSLKRELDQRSPPELQRRQSAVGLSLSARENDVDPSPSNRFSRQGVMEGLNRISGNAWSKFPNKSFLEIDEKRTKSKLVNSEQSKRRWLYFLIFLAMLAFTVGAALGIVERKRLDKSAVVVAPSFCANGGTKVSSDAGHPCTCQSGWGGSYCQLKANCVASKDTQPYSLAEGIVDLSDKASEYNIAINTLELARVINSNLGLQPEIVNDTTQCKHQLDLISLPNLPPSSYPKRSKWAETALLWNIEKTESDSSDLWRFIAGLNFNSKGDKVGLKPDVGYQKTVAGYTFDFAAMSIFPAVAQVRATVNDTVRVAFEKVASFAVASSIQRSNALSSHWLGLGLNPSDLPIFKTAIAALPIMFPFNASVVDGGVPMMDLATAQLKSEARGIAESFPPAVGCRHLSPDALEDVNSIESSVFGLSNISDLSNDTLCIDRPLYGILNILNLRLPFDDSDPRTSLPRQAVIPKMSIKNRVSLHAGELLVGQPAGQLSTRVTSAQVPQTIGTFDAFDHVLLEYLQLFSNVTATALVNYALSGSSTPANASTFGGVALYRLPVLEVQLWGGLASSDMDHTVAGISNSPLPNSQFFFGSTIGKQFRDWSHGFGNTSTASTWHRRSPKVKKLKSKFINKRSLPPATGRIYWARSATEVQVIEDDPTNNIQAFNSAWTAASYGTSLIDVASLWRSLLGTGLAATPGTS